MSLNIENVKQLSEFLRTLPDNSFNHGFFLERLDSFNYYKEADRSDVYVEEKNVCGTVACIAGWAAILGTHDYTVDAKGAAIFPEEYSYSGPAAKWLGLEGAEVGTLFWPFDMVGTSAFDYTDQDGNTVVVPANEGFGIALDEWVSLRESNALHSDTTATQAADFLDLMVKENRIDIRWWATVKGIEL